MHHLVVITSFPKDNLATIASFSKKTLLASLSLFLKFKEENVISFLEKFLFHIIS